MMSTTKRPPDIRTSYTPLERAILSAYLGYPDPAPDELEGIDITETVDPEEWDESVEGIAPLPSLYGGDRVSDIDKAGECIRAWWSSLAPGQQRWAYLFATGAVDEETAARWADQVWGGEGDGAEAGEEL